MKARTSKRQPKKDTSVKDLEKIGIKKYETLRFKEHGLEVYTLGKAFDIAKDGSVSLYSADGGGWRSIMPEKLQRQVVGPRGGRKWEPIKSV